MLIKCTCGATPKYTRVPGVMAMVRVKCPNCGNGGRMALFNDEARDYWNKKMRKENAK